VRGKTLKEKETRWNEEAAVEGGNGESRFDRIAFTEARVPSSAGERRDSGRKKAGVTWFQNGRAAFSFSFGSAQN